MFLEDLGIGLEGFIQTDRCLVIYRCTLCGSVNKPKYGDCCVFISYGSNVCPYMQTEMSSRIKVTFEKK